MSSTKGRLQDRSLLATKPLQTPDLRAERNMINSQRKAKVCKIYNHKVCTLWESFLNGNIFNLRQDEHRSSCSPHSHLLLCLEFILVPTVRYISLFIFSKLGASFSYIIYGILPSTLH